MTSAGTGRIGGSLSEAGSGAKSSAKRAHTRPLLLLAAASLFLGTVCNARAQVEASANKPLGSMIIYGLASADDNQHGYPKTLGGTGGITVTRSGLFGMTMEASAIDFRSQVHDYTALTGPRFSIGYLRYKPYVEGLIGFGRASYLEVDRLPERHTTQAYGLAYGAAVGLDLQLTSHLTWRVVQLERKHVSAGPGVRIYNGSTGFALRF